MQTRMIPRSILALLLLVLAGCARDPVATSLATSLADNVPECKDTQLSEWQELWDKAQHSLGVTAKDPDGHSLGKSRAKKILFFSNWIPLTGNKEVLCGEFHHFNWYRGAGEEDDYNIYIIPSAPFSSKFEKVKKLYYRPGVKKKRLMWKACAQPADCVETELTPHKGLSKSEYFKRPRVEFLKPVKAESRMEGDPICVYGPWVRESIHGNRPEIHPTEMIWWRDPMGTLHMMVLQDASNRFRDPGHFNKLGNLRPWAKPPRRGVFTYPFKVDPQDLPLVFETRDVHHGRVDTDGESDNTVYPIGGDKVVEVIEHDDKSLKVSIDYVCQPDNADDDIIGTITLTTKLGGMSPRYEGFHVFTLTRNQEPSRQPVVASIETEETDTLTLVARAISSSLRRQVVDGEARLFGDLELSMQVEDALPLGATGQEVKADTLFFKKDIFLAPVGDEFQLFDGTLSFVEHSLALEMDSDSTLRLTNVPVKENAWIGISTITDDTLWVEIPALSFESLITREEPIEYSENALAWPILLESIGIEQKVERPTALQVIQVDQWEFDVGVLYGTVRDSVVYLEDDFPFSDRLNEVLYSGSASEIANLFGTEHPIQISWTSQDTVDTQVDISNQTVRVALPKASPDRVYTVEASTVVQAPYGDTGTKELAHQISSHFLTAESEDEILRRYVSIPLRQLFCEFSVASPALVCYTPSPRLTRFVVIG